MIDLKEVDRAYLAGLFDGEGCANATLGSKMYKEKYYWWPKLQFTIVGREQHIQQVRKLFDLGGYVYNQARQVWELRTTTPEQIIRFIDVILPYAKLKIDQLQLLKEAGETMLQHKRRSKWTQEELESFNVNFVQPLQRLKGSNHRKGRKRVHLFTITANPNSDK